MDLLYLSPYAPDPQALHAGGQFFARYLAAIATSDAVTSVRVALPGGRENLDALDRVPPGVEVHVVDSPIAPMLGWRKWPELVRYTLAGGVAGRRYATTPFLRDPVVLGWLDEADLVEVQWPQFLGFLPVVRRRRPGLPLVAFEHDVVTQYLQRRAAEAGRWPFRAGGRFAAWRAARREPALLNAADAVFAFSEKDEVVLRSLGVRPPVLVVAPPVDVPPAPAPLTGADVLFVGAMWRRENFEAAGRLLDRVWPSVRSSGVGARLVVAGADPPDLLLSRAADDVVFTGFVEDLTPLFLSAAAFVVPLYLGAGVKFKVLHAMAAGLPVVATTVGAEGVVDRSGPAVFAAITDDPSDMAAAVVRVLADRAWSASVGAAARSWVSGAYDFDATMATVLRRYESLVARR